MYYTIIFVLISHPIIAVNYCQLFDI